MNCEIFIHIKCLKGSKQSFNRFLVDREMLAWGRGVGKKMMILDTDRLYYVLLLLIGL